MPQNLIAGPPPTHLPEDEAARDQLAGLLASGSDVRPAAAEHPAYSLAWAVLAEQALDGGDAVTAYAFARTGYHRGLDALRRSGWRGTGPVPWEHEPNRGFLRALAALGRAAAAIGEAPEADRCREFLHDSSESAAAALPTW
ncbi:uncharacterized protein DUF3151 [Motilibacter rhizosphaerae]|uniref:Uncharacterized protein DUF3151 n=2 Tax=Motilibacter rhizosphaerae TaxID=598652 RepID=A0A4Q7NUS0_9ACTN|nr:DUF3151 domain-containing protein [Motilibacter rhizosphaerae]RZS90917.1 uncharacterized protein DUF3151 [Motilibacter rhizosphaerae]